MHFKWTPCSKIHNTSMTNQTPTLSTYKKTTPPWITPPTRPNRLLSDLKNKRPALRTRHPTPRRTLCCRRSRRLRYQVHPCCIGRPVRRRAESDKLPAGRRPHCPPEAGAARRGRSRRRGRQVADTETCCSAWKKREAILHCLNESTSGAA